MSVNSEMTTQMVYGDGFSIIKKSRNWLKIQIKEDGYIGFIKKKKFTLFINPTHKVCKVYAYIYKYSNYSNVSTHACGIHMIQIIKTIQILESS